MEKPIERVESNQEQPTSGIRRWLPYDSSLTFVQFITFLLCVFFPISFVVFVSSAQIYVLKYVLDEKQELGKLTSYLGIADQVVSLIMVAVWGLVSDKISRKWVFVIGYIITGVSIILFPYCKNVLPQLLLVRMIFGFGSSAPLAMVTAGLADVRGQRHAGKLTGLVGFMSGLGALFGAMVWLRLISTFLTKHGAVQGIRYAFITVGLVSIVWGVIVAFFYQSGRVQNIQDDVPGLTNIKYHVMRWLRALKLGVTRPLVGLGYIGGMAARGDTLILTTFLTLWVSTYFEQQGDCGTFSSANADSIQDTCRAAFTQGHVLSGIGQALALVGAPFFGIALDYISSVYVLFFSCILAFVGYFGLANQLDPKGKASYAYIALIGLTEIGTIICSMKVLSDGENVDKKERGNISGVYSFFGSIGIMIGVSLGGYLFDNYGSTSPFYLVGSAHVLLAVLSVGVIAFKLFKRY